MATQITKVKIHWKSGAWQRLNFACSKDEVIKKLMMMKNPPLAFSFDFLEKDRVPATPKQKRLRTIRVHQQDGDTITTRITGSIQEIVDYYYHWMSPDKPKYIEFAK